jgi:hypothetical protein
VTAGRSLKDMERSITRLTNVGYESYHILMALILMHNIDVMHQERNVDESIVMMCMDFLDKTKDKKSKKRLGYDWSLAIS